MRITAEQVGIDNLGELTMTPNWPSMDRDIRIRDLTHTALVRTIYTDPDFVLRDPLSTEGLRPLEDFRKVLIARSMADISVEEYYESLFKSGVSMRITPALRSRLIQVVAKQREKFPAGYRSGTLFNSGGTGTVWRYNPPIGRELSDIHDCILKLVLSRNEQK